MLSIDDAVDELYTPSFALSFTLSSFLFLLLTLICTLLAHHIKYDMTLFPAWLCTQFIWLCEDNEWISRIIWCTYGMYMILSLPPMALIAWICHAYITFNLLYALTVALLGTCILTLSYALLRWYVCHYRVTSSIIFAFIMSLALLLAYVIWMLFAAQPYTYLGMSMVFLTFNLIPMLIVTHVVTKRVIRSFHDYPHVSLDFASSDTKNTRLRARPSSSRIIQVQPHKSHPPLATHPSEITPIHSYQEDIPTPKAVTSSTLWHKRLSASPTARAAENEKPLTQLIISNPKSSMTSPSTGSSLTPSPPHTSSSHAHTLPHAPTFTPHHVEIWMDTRLHIILLYTIALLILIAYAIIVYVMVEDRLTSDYERYAGWTTAAAIVALDITLVACVLGERIRSPSRVTIFLTLSRILLLSFGGERLFVGHSLLYLCLGIYFGHAMIDTYFPSDTTSQLYASALKDLEQRSASRRPSFLHPSTPSSPSLPIITPTPQTIDLTSPSHFSIHVNTYSWCFLTICFIMDIAMAWNLHPRKLDLPRAGTDQFLVGVFALFATLIMIALMFLYRLYANNRFLISQQVVIVAALGYACVVGSGIFFHVMINSYLTLSLCCFGPPVVYLTLILWTEWRRHDHHYCSTMEQIIAYDDEAKDKSYIRLMLTARLPGYDYLMLCGGTLDALLILAFSISLWWQLDSRWVGCWISASMLVMATTLIPVVEWFNTFEVSRGMILSSIVSFSTLTGFCLSFYYIKLEGINDENALVVLICYFGYLSCITLCISLYKLKDDQWRITHFVKMGLALSTFLIGVLAVAIMILFPVARIHVLAAALVGVTIAAMNLVLYLRSRFAHIALFLLCILILAILSLAVVISILSGHVFYGVTVTWATVTLSIIVYTCHEYYTSFGDEHVIIYYSEHALPCYQYRPAPGLRNPLIVRNRRIYLIWLIVLSIFLWGVFAVYLAKPAIIGLASSSAAIVALLAFHIHIRWTSLTQLATAMATIDFDSNAYRDLLTKARTATMNAQLQVKHMTTFHSCVAPLPTFPKLSRHTTPRIRSIIHPITTNLAHTTGSGPGSGLPSPQAQPASPTDAPINNPLFNVKRKSISSAQHDMDIDAKHTDVMIGVDENPHWTRSPSSPCVSPPRRFSTSSQYDDKTYHQPIPHQATEEIESISHTHAMQQPHQEINIEEDEDVDGTNDAVLLEDLLNGNTKDWRVVLASFQELRALLATPWCGTEKYQVRTIPFKGNDLSLSSAHLHLRQLDHRVDLLYTLYTQYIAQYQIEVMLAANDLRRSRERILLSVVQRYEASSHATDDRTTLIRTISLHAPVKKRMQQLLQEYQREIQDSKLAREHGRQSDAMAQEKRDVGFRTHMHMYGMIARRMKHVQQAMKQRREAAMAARGSIATTVNSHISINTTTTNESSSPPTPSSPTAAQRASVDPMQLARSQTILTSRMSTADPSSPPREFSAILAHCEATRTPFVDTSFPPNATSLYMDPSRPRAKWAHLIWKRASEFITDPKLFAGPLHPACIKQGLLGDCWFISAISVLALRPQHLRDCFILGRYTPWGCYAVRFYKNGGVITVIIDDYLPILPTSQRAAFGSSLHPDELWVMIIEKAYAKLHRSYEAIECGFIDTGLVDLTGGSGDRIDLKTHESAEQIRNGSLWNQIVSYFESGYLMGGGSSASTNTVLDPSEPPTQAKSKNGIVYGHAYAITSIREVDGHHLIQLRNPWGHVEWTGDWSNQSTLWTRRMCAKLQYYPHGGNLSARGQSQETSSNNPTDGLFWMSWQDFVDHFDDIFVCRFFDTSHWPCQITIHDEWKGITAGGCTNYPSVGCSPQYLLTCPQDTDVVITLAQNDGRGTGEEEFAIGIEIYRNDGQRITKRKRGRLMGSNPSGYVIRRDVALQLTLPADNNGYTVLVSTFYPKQEREYTIKLYASRTVTLTSIPQATTAIAVTVTVPISTTGTASPHVDAQASRSAPTPVPTPAVSGLTLAEAKHICF